MNPIRYELQEKEIVIKDFNDIENGYEIKEHFSFVPEFLEKIYEGVNKQRLLSQNTSIQHYVNEKPNYQYIGSLRMNDETKIEFYFTKENQLIEFLILIPKNPKYYVSVQAVAIFEKNNDLTN